jgi:hypothetical protein
MVRDVNRFLELIIFNSIFCSSPSLFGCFNMAGRLPHRTPKKNTRRRLFTPWMIILAISGRRPGGYVETRCRPDPASGICPEHEVHKTGQD